MTLSPETKRILLVDADVAVRRRVAEVLTAAGFQVATADDPRAAVRSLAQRHHDAVIAALGEGDPVDSIRAILDGAGRTPLLVVCDPDQVRAAVATLEHGVQDYLLRPPDPYELKTRLRRILERHDLDSRISFFQAELSKKHGVADLAVHSASMRSVLDRVLRVAPLRSTVLIFGESGVGKELVARAIHFNSPRVDRSFIGLNCAAIPASLIESELFGHEKGSFTGAHARARGKFEIAHQGTLFLDEIGEMEPTTQAKLLRVLEEREFMRIGGDQTIRVDVRLIAATNADLESLVADSTFRRDLYYRLKVVTIAVPPLRERKPDIPALVETFLDQLSRANAVVRRLTPAALEALQQYRWPGNVRELKNLLESFLVSVPGELIDLDDLPAYLVSSRAPAERVELRPGMTLAAMERELIRRTLEQTGGNRTHSAALLGIGVRTLQRKIRSYELEIPSTRRRPRRRTTSS